MKKRKMMSIVSLITILLVSSSNVYAIDKDIPSIDVYTPSNLQPYELPDVDDLTPYELPDTGFVRPSNMPDINTNLNKIYKKAMNELEDGGYQENNYEDGIGDMKIYESQNSQDNFKTTFGEENKGTIDDEYATKGHETKWDNEEFENYIKNVEDKYLPALNSAKEESSEAKEYDTDLSAAWKLTSYKKASSTYNKLPDYDDLKDELKETATLDTSVYDEGKKNQESLMSTAKDGIQSTLTSGSNNLAHKLSEGNSAMSSTQSSGQSAVSATTSKGQSAISSAKGSSSTGTTSSADYQNIKNYVISKQSTNNKSAVASLPLPENVKYNNGYLVDNRPTTNAADAAANSVGSIGTQIKNMIFGTPVY